jgi:hypothetical protein
MVNQQANEALGYRMETLPNLKTTPRMTFYNKDGVPLANLPADSYHMKRYLARGFTITPPAIHLLEEPQSEVSVGEDSPIVKRKYRKRKHTSKRGE